MTLTKSWLQKQITDLETTRDEIPFGLDEDGNNTLAALKLALAGMEAEPVAWIVGGIATNDKKWAVRRSEEDNLLMEPLYMHPIITGIDENHYDPELEPGLYVAEIMTKGGAAIINGYYTAPQPLTTSERAELENYRNAQVVRSITQHFDDIALETAREIMCDVNRRHEFLGGEVQLLSRIQCRVDDACRAAMLQGKADGNSPVIPDGYVLVPKEITCAMDDAAWEAYHETRCMSDIWAALLAAAAPQQESE